MSDSGNQIYQQIDSINSLLSITSEQEMSQKISQNIPIIFQIFFSFKNKLLYNQVNQNDISQVTEALKFVDNLNLFMEELDVRKFKDKMAEIRDILRKRNYDFKEAILKKINYTEMTIIYHKKLYFRNLYFNNHKGLSEEIESEIDQVYKTNKFDFKLFKQMQNIFWVVKNVLDENKKIELDARLKNMKTESQKIKEKKFLTNPFSSRGYGRNDNYMNDYNDYRGYTGYDYIDNFNWNEDNSYYGNKNYANKIYRGRGGYLNNSNRKYYIKKQEEKEIEIPSDPSYYKNKENDEININNIDLNNNINIENNNIDNLNNNNINGGNDIIGNNNIINDINSNGGIKNENDINIIPNNNNNNIILDINNENNGGNGEMPNINTNNNQEVNDINKNDDIEIISSNTNLSSYNRNKKKIYPNKMIAVELPSHEEANNNIINEENNNNGAKIENINNENNNNENEINLNNNNYNNNHNGDNNIEYIQYNNDYRDNKFKNNYYYNNGYKSNIYNKNNYRNNNYNRYNVRNNLSGNNYGDNNQNKKLLFVEIDENNNPIENNVSNNEIINGQGNENNDNISPINNGNEPNGEVISNNNNNIVHENNKEENLNIDNEKKEEAKPEPINEIKTEDNINNINIDNGEKKEINPEIKEEQTIQNNNNIEIPEVKDLKKISENIPLHPEEDIQSKSKSDSNINKIKSNLIDMKHPEDNIQETDEEHFNEMDNVKESDEEDQEIPDDAHIQFKIFAIEAGLQEPKGDFKLVMNQNSNSKEKEENSNNDIENNFDENDLMEYMKADLENEELTGMNDVEQEKAIKLKECLEKLNIPKIIKEALDELEEERELRLKILHKLDDNYKIEATNPKYTLYKNEFFKKNSQLFSNELNELIKEHKNNPAMANMSLSKYLLSKYSNNLPHNKENDMIMKDYIELKVKEIEHPEDIWNNMQKFEKMILIPLYQKTIKARKDKYIRLNEIYNLYERNIKGIFKNSKDLDEVQKFGSFSNTFMIDYGEYDIDICLVPKCQINYFRNTYIDKLIHGLKNCKLGNFKEVSPSENSNSYILLKGEYIDKVQKININILINNKIPIYHSYLLKTYALYDQRFHIMGIYLKYWTKINNLHGPNYLPSYALLFMIIHFLQKIVEPKVLPNLQKIPKIDAYKNIYESEEKTYEYYQDYELMTTNLNFETNPRKIKEYMSEINNNRFNEETVTNLLVKFFEYYSYCYDSNQKISIHKDLRESIKEVDDNIAYSIDDPFDVINNPGKNLEKDSESCKKFVKAMKKEINLILSGEYVKRFEYEKERIARISKK